MITKEDITMLTKTSDSKINIPIFHKNSCASDNKSGSFFCKRKYKGALYVYILIIVLLATTLSLITGLVFDGKML